MSKIGNIIKDNKLHIRMGLNGNYYCFSKDIKKIKAVCKYINKHENSIYFRVEYGCFAIRVRDRKMKSKMKEYKQQMEFVQI